MDQGSVGKVGGNKIKYFLCRMDSQRQENSGLLQAVLPEGMLEYFTLNKVEPLAETINIYLEERNIIPKEYQSDKLLRLNVIL